MGCTGLYETAMDAAVSRCSKVVGKGVAEPDSRQGAHLPPSFLYPHIPHIVIVRGPCYTNWSSVLLILPLLFQYIHIIFFVVVAMAAWLRVFSLPPRLSSPLPLFRHLRLFPPPQPLAPRTTPYHPHVTPRFALHVPLHAVLAITSSLLPPRYYLLVTPSTHRRLARPPRPSPPRPRR